MIGISVLFKVGATADFLEQEGQFCHHRFGVSLVAKLVEERASVGYLLLLAWVRQW